MLGAWGLGWEVWLDGMEVTQFTYFQQAGGKTLEAPAVEITYGLERIMMALQVMEIINKTLALRLPRWPCRVILDPTNNNKILAPSPKPAPNGPAGCDQLQGHSIHRGGYLIWGALSPKRIRDEQACLSNSMPRMG